MNKIVISKLISIANQFDSMGNYEDADRLSDVANSFQAPNKEDITREWINLLRIQMIIKLCKIS